MKKIHQLSSLYLRRASARLLLGISAVTLATAAAAQVDTALFVTPLIAGQNTEIGTVRCGVDPNQPQTGACVAQTTGQWCLNMVHLYVGFAPPASMAPGQFPFQHAPGSCATQVRVGFTLPVVCQSRPYVVGFHAEASRPGQSETAWAKGAPTGSNWSMLGSMPCIPEPR